MARRSDLAVVRFLFSRRLGVSLAPRETQPEISATYADTISSQTFCGAVPALPGTELQRGTKTGKLSLVMASRVGWTRIDRS